MQETQNPRDLKGLLPNDASRQGAEIGNETHEKSAAMPDASRAFLNESQSQDTRLGRSRSLGSRPSTARIISALVLFLAIDQIVKFYVRDSISLGTKVFQAGPFSITHFENTQGPFSLQIPLAILIFITLALCGFLIWRFFRQSHERLAIVCILSGGLSNLIDRLAFQSTTDYLGLPFGGYWNLADVGVLIGIIILLSQSRRTSPQS